MSATEAEQDDMAVADSVGTKERKGRRDTDGTDATGGACGDVLEMPSNTQRAKRSPGGPVRSTSFHGIYQGHPQGTF